MRMLRPQGAEVVDSGTPARHGSKAARRTGGTYGVCAFIVGAFLVWFAAWTVECNALVLTGRHYRLFLWAPLAPTLLMIALYRFRHRIIAQYSLGALESLPAEEAAPLAFTFKDWAFFAGAALISLLAAHIGNKFPTAIPYIIASALVSIALALWLRRTARHPFATVRVEIGWRLPALILLLLLLYYLGHRPDADDSNYINLAIGAQRTHGAVFQFDTMLGDGPNPIHLPTYKFHSFELLAAVLSTYLGIAPIAVFHLLIPAILLPLFAAILMLILTPAVGRYWLAGSFLVVAFMFLNLGTLGGWGIHGIVRFYEGKGFLVSAMLPLMAALAARWFHRGQPMDLAAMLLTSICSLGFSANGLYGAPAAAGLVAAAFLSSEIKSREMWTRAILLTSALAYCAAAAAVIVGFHLALPSEQVGPTFAIGQLNFTASYGIVGRLTLTALALSGLGLLQFGKSSTAALIYFPLAVLLTLNPLSWHLISAATGNLGFRIFWSLPAAALIALTAIAAMRLAGIRSELTVNIICGLALAGSIVLAAVRPDLPEATRIAWHQPDLKVNRAEYDFAERLAARTKPNCRILAPEEYSMQLSMMRRAPYPVFVRKLYLIHYRFTLPRDQLALRNRLRLVVDGPAGIAPPAPSVLRSAGIPIGTVAVRRDAPSKASAAELAKELGLAGPVGDGPLLTWTGGCDAR